MPLKNSLNTTDDALKRRRKPVQARATGTVMLIFEAAAQIIQSQGLEAFTTNHVAQKAGVSIGSLYQYFPNKEALLIAMAEHQMQQVAQDIRKAVQRCQGDLALDLELEVVRTLFAKLGTHYRVRHILCDFVIRVGRGDILQAPLTEADQVLQEQGLALRPIERFVLASAVQGIIRNVTRDKSSWLKDPDLPLEVASLMKAYRGSVAATLKASVKIPF